MPSGIAFFDASYSAAMLAAEAGMGWSDGRRLLS